MRLEYVREGSGPAFVYVCGLEGTGKLFYKQAADLARDHTVISFPLRAEGRYDLARLVADVDWVVRDAGFERATFLGESFGGLLVLAAALARPSIFERMILVNTFAHFAGRARIRLGVALFSALPDGWLTAYRARTSPRTLFSADIAEEDRRLFRDHTRAIGREGYISRLRIIRDTDLRARLRDITIPALVVAGTADRLLNSVAAARVLSTELPRARLKLLAGTGHAALLSERVRVRDWLAEFDGL